MLLNLVSHQDPPMPPILEDFFLSLIEDDWCPQCLHHLKDADPDCSHCGYEVGKFLADTIGQ